MKHVYRVSVKIWTERELFVKASSKPSAEDFAGVFAAQFFAPGPCVEKVEATRCSEQETIGLILEENIT